MTTTLPFHSGRGPVSGPRCCPPVATVPVAVTRSCPGRTHPRSLSSPSLSPWSFSSVYKVQNNFPFFSLYDLPLGPDSPFTDFTQVPPRLCPSKPSPCGPDFRVEVSLPAYVTETSGGTVRSTTRVCTYWSPLKGSTECRVCSVHSDTTGEMSTSLTPRVTDSTNRLLDPPSTTIDESRVDRWVVVESVRRPTRGTRIRSLFPTIVDRTPDGGSGDLPDVSTIDDPRPRRPARRG